MCRINILHLIEGAKQAEGLTVIIDVFRAFSLECYLYDMGVKQIRPVGTIEEAFSLKNRIPNSILMGERQGKKCDGFDYGNSPSTIRKEDVAGKTIIHTTSAGTQGIVNAVHASEIITGSLVNAKAVAEYIIARQPQTVSLVCMGNGGVRPAPEDEMCAEYIKSILEGREFLDLEQRVSSLKNNGGEHFFDKNRQNIFPEADFYMCVKCNKFPFVIKIEKDEIGFVASKENVLNLELIRVGVEDARHLWEMQVEAFMELYHKYQDTETSPATEPIDKIIMRLEQPSTYYYYIQVDNDIVGAIRVVDKKKDGKAKRISPIFVMPHYRNKGIAQKAILEAEKIHGASHWELGTILQEKGNCHLYEKMGYYQTGQTKVINDKMTLVFYKKE